MTYQEIEASKERGAPYELYKFQYGPGANDTYLYSNSVGDVDGYENYTQLPIQRDQYKTTGKAERDQMNITVPASSELARMILPYPPPYEVYVTIYQGHFDGGDPMVVWVGRLLSNAFERGTVILTCESTLISLKRQGARRRWQVGCPLLLYSQGTGQCNANRDDFTVEAVVVGLIDNDPIFAANWFLPFAVEQFTHGMLRWVSPYGVEYRTIRNAQPTRLIFNGPLRGLEIGDTVQVILGCAHDPEDCKDVFDNILNYGGDPWIPLQNPTKHPNFW